MGSMRDSQSRASLVRARRPLLVDSQVARCPLFRRGTFGGVDRTGASPRAAASSWFVQRPFGSVAVSAGQLAQGAIRGWRGASIALHSLDHGCLEPPGRAELTKRCTRGDLLPLVAEHLGERGRFLRSIPGSRHGSDSMLEWARAAFATRIVSAEVTASSTPPLRDTRDRHGHGGVSALGH